MAKIEIVNINDISTNDINPRKIEKEKFVKLIKSIQEFPEMLQVRPIVVDNNNIILGGNQRYLACKKLGYDKVPIIRATDLSEEQYEEFVLKDNMLSGKWDIQMLLDKWDKELIEKIGLEIPRIIEANMQNDEAIDIDNLGNERYELSYNIEINRDDIIDIGKHRLLCGDSTKKQDHNRLFKDVIPFLMVTDPPYGVNYDPKKKIYLGLNKKINSANGIVINDDRFDWSETIRLFEGNVIYMWHASSHSIPVGLSLINNGFPIRQLIIWNKDGATIGRTNYHYKHEPCWYAVRKGKSGKWKGGRTQTTVWDINKVHATFHGAEDGKTYHSTQKPIECMARPIINHGDKSDIVYDPFLGSGTSMLAAEKNDRICYGMEINPDYCKIIIDRMLRHDNTLGIKINGKKVDI